MKKLIAVAALATLPAATGFASDINGSTVPATGMSELAKYADIVSPSLRGREFSLLSIGARTQFGIGCDGVASGAIASQVVGEMQQYINYFRSNIGGLIANFLIYSSPTLYQLMENMNVHREFARDLQVFSCSTVRQMASDERNKTLAEAKNKCLADGSHSPEDCDNAGTLKSYMPAAVDELNKKLRNLSEGNRDFNLREILARSAGGAGGFQKAASTANAAAQQQTAELHQVVQKLLYNMEETDQKDKERFRYDPPELRVADVIEERDRLYLEKITEMVDYGAQLSASATGGGVTDSDAYRYLQNDPGFGPIAPSTIATLIRLRREKPWEFQQAAAALARQMSTGYVRYAIAWQEAQFANVLSGGEGELLSQYGPEVQEHMRRDIDRLKAELAVEEARSINTSRVQSVEHDIGTLF